MAFTILAAALLFGAECLAADSTPAEGWVYYEATLAELDYGTPGLPAELKQNQWVGAQGYHRLVVDALAAVRVEEGEGHLARYDRRGSAVNMSRWGMALKLPAGREPQGELWLPSTEGEGPVHLVRIPFRVPASVEPVAEERFQRVREVAYQGLVERGVPGQPYFRFRAGKPETGRGVRNPWRPTGEWERSYGLFTGTTALRENLQIDLLRQQLEQGEATVDVARIRGITIDPVDWSSLLHANQPALEPLAGWVPEDRILVSFSSFRGLVQLVDELESWAPFVMTWLEPRSESADTRASVERQLCLRLDSFARLLGPAAIRSVAFTASDPYLREGTDLAVLFETTEPTLVLAQLQGGWARASAAQPCTEVHGEHRGITWSGLMSADRRISSLACTVDDVVVVANSEVILKAILDARDGTVPSFAGSEEYHFMRQRYPFRSGSDEVLLMLSDPFLRRLCGPAERIGESRRLRCAAVQDLWQARALFEGPELADQWIAAEGLGCPEHGNYEARERGILCSLHGGTGFLTPVAERPISKVTLAERDAYERFRDRYQSYPRQFFDPIALWWRGGDSLELDLTVMPLIDETEYRELRGLTAGGGKLTARHGDPHPEAVLQFVVHLDPDSREVEQWNEFLEVLPGLMGRPLSWLGDSFELYLDDSPVLDGVAQAASPDEWLEEHIAEVPLAIRAAVKNPLTLGLFLSGARAFIEGSAPGMLEWATGEHAEQPYAVVSASDNARRQFGELADLRILYGGIGNALVVTLDETLLQRAIDREVQRGSGGFAQWLGEHAAVEVNLERLDGVMRFLFQQTGDRELERCFANLPALYEWRRLFPDAMPVAVHRERWGVELSCPVGGEYRLAAGGTIECSEHGDPFEPRSGGAVPTVLRTFERAAAGLTFEEQGLRVRLRAERGSGGK